MNLQYLPENTLLKDLCKKFVNDTHRMPRYILGTNAYADRVSEHIDVDGFIDEFTVKVDHLDKPVIKSIKDIPSNAIVVSTVIGKPVSVRNKLGKYQIRHIDYFSFVKYSQLDILPIRFWEAFKKDFYHYYSKYVAIYELLEDHISRQVFEDIINFRLSYNLDYMTKYEDAQERQYFEDFLGLSERGEIFVDVGGFDGYTTEEFIRRYPGYRSIHFFEPLGENMAIAKKRLVGKPSVKFHLAGVSNRKDTLRLEVLDDRSRISKNGTEIIGVDTIDNMVNDSVSFIKMDIEGGESEAIDGARQTIEKNHPRLAIAAYHKKDDFWKIPEKILRVRSDYKIYMRHYTEGVDETVMFFVPPC